MKNILKHKNEIIVGALIIAVLAFVYCWGGNAPSLRNNSTALVTVNNTYTPAKPLEENTQASIPSSMPTYTPIPVNSVTIAPEKQEIKKQGDEATEQNKPKKADNTPMTAEEKIEIAKQMTGTVQIEAVGDAEYSEQQGMDINENTGTDSYQTISVLQDEPVPVEPLEVEIKDNTLTCTLSIRCDTILQNIAWLEKEKVDIVPKDGVIFAEKEVIFYEGESVFNVLLREMKRNKIHFEYVNTPIYNSAYIEGIANLYEFDCGELSGWVYRVNDWFPNYGCSRYMLKQGDKIEWLYTCDLGIDVGSMGGLQRDE